MIRELHEKLRAGEETAENLTQTYLDRIDEQVNAYIAVDAEGALAGARRVDEKIVKGESISLLAGIPGGIKDLIALNGVRMTAGSKILENYTAPYDATVTERLKSEDAIIIGKQNLDEFACGSSTESSAYGMTRNPHNLEYVPGGSSGGSAAAVAAGEAVWSLGTDTGGSIRQPAAFCGVVGLKPTYGRVSRYGVSAYGSSLDQVGPIAQTVEDVAIVLSAIAGHDPRDATSAQSHDKDYHEMIGGSIAGAKIGVPREYLGEGLDDGMRTAYFNALDVFKAQGAEIVDISLPQTSNALATYYVIALAELSSNLARFDGVRYGYSGDAATAHDSIADFYEHVRSTGFGAEIKRRLILGTYVLSAGYYDAYYKKAGKVRSLIHDDFKKALDQVDFIFTPTTPSPAFKIGEKTDDPLSMYLEDVYTVPVNLAGVPAMSIPIGTVDTGDAVLPVGGQIIGKWFDEEGVLGLGYAYENSVK